jgi:hypothetical protein
MAELGQGIHFDVPASVYFSDPAPQPSLTQSIAKILLEQSPLHAWHQHPRLGAKAADEGEVDKYDSAQAIGNAAHKLLIGRGKDVAVGDFDAWRSKEAKAFREDAERAGTVAILQRHFVRARNMVDVAQEQLGDMFGEGGSGETVIIWEDNGIWFRSMIDWLRSDLRMVCDYKTTGMSCAPHAIPSLMLNGGWDIQAAMHERGLDALDPDNAGRRKFRFVAQENTEPYALTLCELPESVLTMGRKKLAHAIQIWERCIVQNRWPGYPTEIVYPEYPGWAEAQWLNREISTAARERMPVNVIAAG